MAEERVLIRKQGSLKARITGFKNYLTKLETEIVDQKLADVQATELEQRYLRVITLIDNFSEIQDQIESISENVDEQFIERENFETVFYDLTSKAKTLLDSHQPVTQGGAKEPSRDDEFSSAASAITSSANAGNYSSQVKLPTIQLPKFDGSFNQWLEFRDTFESLIHTNNSISDIQKYHYLRAALIEDASQVIKSIEFSATNYSVAWEILCNRFNNTRLLIQNHVKALFTIEPIGQESADKLRKFIDTVSKHLRSLEQLNQPTSQWDTLVIYIISTKLDVVTNREWEQYKSNNQAEIPTFDNLKKFLKDRADLLDTIEVGSNQSQNEKRPYKGRKNRESTSKTRGLFVSNICCPLCKETHFLYSCNEFKTLAVKERMERTKRLKLCINCLRAGHSQRDCKFGPCKFCRGKHNSPLHVEQSPAQSQASSYAQVENSNGNSEVTLSASEINRNVLLSTAFVKILDKDGYAHKVRALLDSGSQSSFMREDLCEFLKLRKNKIELTVQGLNQSISKINYKCEANIQNQQNSFSTSISCFILSEITGNLPHVQLNTANVVIPENIRLADPTFHKPGRVDILIGADLFWSLIGVGQVKLGQNMPILQKTKLGWIVAGSINLPTANRVHCSFSKTLDIQDQLAKFWCIEECAVKNAMTSEEEMCESHFQKTTKRLGDGRFVVSIPLKESPAKLGSSREQAEKRYYHLERKLQVNSKLRDMYTAFLTEYQSLNHMTTASESYSNNVSYYMPHHGVLREQSTTTKLRVVFDASAASSSGVSLNDLQGVGPTIQDDLFSIILRFRKYKVVITADIEKMYRQILVEPNQRALQQILWHASPTEELKSYRLNTVTYGTASASFLAIRCLHELTKECRALFPKAADIIESDFYVDDLLTGADSVEEATTIVKQIAQILDGGCFKLHKWHSNVPATINAILQNSDLQYDTTIDFQSDNDVKTLGLIWACQNDELRYSTNKITISAKVTKRTILSAIAQIFDPLGLIGPCVVVIKLLLQKLWLQKLSWDESVPSDLHLIWCKFADELEALNRLQINCDNIVNVQLLGFCDASEGAYGACFYVRSVTAEGQIFTSLLCSKSKVAPLKPLTIPRLELCAALILSRLWVKIREALKMTYDYAIFWTDSTIVLGWIKTTPNLLKTFVRNRVAEIQEATNEHSYRHVVSRDNPADLISRGISPGQIQNAELWWKGPKFLSEPERQWPDSKAIIENVSELRKSAVALKITIKNDGFPFKRFSSLNKLKRVVAYMFRFKNNCSKPLGQRQTEPLSVNEIQYAFDSLIRASQRETFSHEFSSLKNQGSVGAKSKVLSLNPFIDNDGILKVGGRLVNSEFCYNKMHPAILGSEHTLTKLIFVDEHIRLLHSGPQLLLATIRERFWRISGRRLARSTVSRCVTCFRQKPKSISPIMGNLPKSRVQLGYPFQTTGVDYGGPYLIKDKGGRRARISKCWICLFVCFATKAIHLELVSELTTEAFILALRRFVSRRGMPSAIYSDNGTNFVGSNTELEKLGNFLTENESELINSCSSQGISWNFIPAHSPHFGGLWEAGIKSTKHHLKRILGNASLTFENFYTMLVQIEAVLNSRPLSPLSSHPDDLIPLTPSHFLVGRSITSDPDPDVRHIQENRLSRFQQLQQLCQHFWERWSKEYISELQQRTKWKQGHDQLQVDQLVVIKEDNLPPMKWKLGRISSLHPGSDGVTRVVSIHTPNGVVKRAFSKVCPLPNQEVSSDL